MTFVVVPAIISPRLVIKPSNVEKLLDFMFPDVVLTGFALSGAASPVTVGTGKALIKGIYVEITVAEAKALTASSTNHIYIQLTRDGNNEVTGAQVTSNTTGTLPADSIKVGEAVTDVSNNITALTAKRDLKEDEDVIYLNERPSAPANPENTADAKIYVKNVDSNNQGLFVKLKVDGSIREVRLG